MAFWSRGRFTEVTMQSGYWQARSEVNRVLARAKAGAKSIEAD